MCRIRGAKAPPYYVWGSPLLALRTEPNFAKCVALEIRPTNVRVLNSRAQPHSGRSIIRQGDVNVVLPGLIQQEVPVRSPCFCLLDPQGTELHWSTVASVALAPGRRRKPELLILFPLAMGFLRLLTTSKQMSSEQKDQVDRLFPTREWWNIYQDRLSGKIAPADAKEQYLEIYAGELRRLGYWVHTLLITTAAAAGAGGRELYYLVFASDHPAGERIMKDVMNRPYDLDLPITQQPLLLPPEA